MMFEKIQEYSFIKKLRALLFNKIEIQTINSIYRIDIQNINYDNYDTRDIKISLIEHYLSELALNHSFKKQMLNQLFLHDSKIHYLTCLIKYLIGKDDKIIKLNAPFISVKDINILKNYLPNIKKIKHNRVFP